MMRLDQGLVQRGLCESRTEAQELIKRGLVSINGSLSYKQSKEIKDDDTLTVLGRRDFVSRGGDKLRGILQDVYGEDRSVREHVQGKLALDIGSSTGGFTDCLLRYGVTHVDAVDGGTMQLHEKLRDTPQVSVYENTDIREFKTGTAYDIIVADLSFIPLHNVFKQIVRLGSVGTDYFLLIKPQFEVGKGNTKKGIVKDQSLVSEILRKYEVLARLHGFERVRLLPCRIQGGDGNQEYFFYSKMT